MGPSELSPEFLPDVTLFQRALRQRAPGFRRGARRDRLERRRGLAGGPDRYVPTARARERGGRRPAAPPVARSAQKIRSGISAGAPRYRSISSSNRTSVSDAPAISRDVQYSPT